MKKFDISVDMLIYLNSNRSRILYHWRMQPAMRILKVIRACITLHNMALMQGVEYWEPSPEICGCKDWYGHPDQFVGSDDDSDSYDEVDDRDGVHFRNTLAMSFMM
ncbi:hypothetical protein QAD02_009201 [Eretmocerus hayati]|uniref:Uncharacterized protein n=1 Tax=Eretmocerus hayati TaxID=131215 RepID=A0ACC2N8V1_9HYME|nr:hypothetical protein QAD02_009201 [Eretmocerus hayati]